MTATPRQNYDRVKTPDLSSLRALLGSTCRNMCPPRSGRHGTRDGTTRRRAERAGNRPRTRSRAARQPCGRTRRSRAPSAPTAPFTSIAHVGQPHTPRPPPPRWPSARPDRPLLHMPALGAVVLAICAAMHDHPELQWHLRLQARPAHPRALTHAHAHRHQSV